MFGLGFAAPKEHCGPDSQRGGLGRALQAGSPHQGRKFPVGVPRVFDFMSHPVVPSFLFWGLGSLLNPLQAKESDLVSSYVARQSLSWRFMGSSKSASEVWHFSQP